MLLIMIGLICIVLGAIFYVAGICQIDNGAWPIIFLPFSPFFFFGGIAVFLIGLGAFFSHPHTIHF